MFKVNNNDTVFLPKEATCRIGNITYIVTSHYDDNAEPLVAKIKNLLKIEISKIKL